ncbi:MAG: nicotinate-nucleotide adenylyltransferase [Chloroflexi bacterium]|nr:nicotinate-nucleotide adenylyltransferase [Chloroflexota bacterium]MBT7079904.1 nicotinate-nucleotide adenylyltransferase [Chloroflexota bacterium]MBT7288876.1 nicotinate-nucleotide adenylyltransferase [Chloroflexota bacterium]
MGKGIRIGIFGGTFDPIHVGHLKVAQDAADKLGLDKVVFLPAGKPWFKSDRLITAGKQRLSMIELAIVNNPLFAVSDLELLRDGPTYSIESIPALKSEFGSGDDLYFLIGLDALSDIHKWKQPARLLDMCRVVGLTRPGHTQIDFGPIERKVPGAAKLIQVIEVKLVDVSSTAIRRKVADGLSIKDLVPDAVNRFIAAHRLYK